MSDELYIKYAIAHESICVDGVRLSRGFNKLSDREFNKLSRSKFRKRGIYDLFDQENEVEQAKKAEAEAEELKAKIIKQQNSTETTKTPVEKEDSLKVETPSDPETVIEDEEDYSPVEGDYDYAAFSYEQLVEHVKTAGIKPKSMKKVDILEALKGE